MLVDLANVSGFYRVTNPAFTTAGRDEIVFNEGMRSVFGRIFQHIRMSDNEVHNLEVAARQSAAQSSLLAPNIEGD